MSVILNKIKRKIISYLKGRRWGGVEVEHVTGGGWCGGVGSNLNTSLRLAKGRRIEELSGSLKAVCCRKRLSHGVQTHSHSLVKTHK